LGAACYDTTYTPYGEEHWTVNNPSCQQNYKFTCYERDSETGLDYAVARYYNSRLGRFMSPDPLGGSSTDPQTLNRYAYVGNSPTTFTDPFGKEDGCPQGQEPSSVPGFGCVIVGTGTGPAPPIVSTTTGPPPPPPDPSINFTGGGGGNNDTYWNCVKVLANAGSVSNALGIGDNKVAGLFLGSTTGSVIQLAQDLSNWKAGATTSDAIQIAAGQQIPKAIQTGITKASITTAKNGGGHRRYDPNPDADNHFSHRNRDDDNESSGYVPR
jgi:RHS repeat-associated protein